MKRSNQESNSNNSKRPNISGTASSGNSASSPPPLAPHMYNASLSQYYGYSGHNTDQRYPPGIPMVSVIDYKGMYSSYNGLASSSNWSNYSQNPQQSNLLFNPSHPPPPLPPDAPNRQNRPPLPPQPSSPAGNAQRSVPMQMPNFMRRGHPRGQFPVGRGMDRGGMKRGMFQHRQFNIINMGAHLSNKQMKSGIDPMRRSDNSQNHSPQSNQNFAEVIDADAHEKNHIQINKKSKRKPMSTRYTRKREWKKEDAIKAIALENEYNRLQRTPMLILKFPDPELNKEIVKKYSTAIETVHFQQPSTPRYCFVQLKDDADIENVKEEISQIPFGTGKVVVEKKNHNCEENQPVSPEEIDPYTLYVGNLPTTVSVAVVKEKFPTGHRIDIGYAQRMKYTRYAFVRYHSVEEAMEAYKKTYNLVIESRSLIVRFRRQKGNVGLPGETKVQNPKKQPPTKEDEPNGAVKIAVNVDEVVQEESIPNNTSKKVPELVDSKVNILKGTESQINSRIYGNANTERIKQEDDSEVETEPDYNDNYDEESIGNDLLGTKVKDEPPDYDDYYMDDAHYYDHMDDELPPDEDDEVLGDICNPQDDDEVDDDDASIYGRGYWDRLRQQELTAKENKPDMSLLPAFNTDNTEKTPATENNDAAEKNDDEDLDELFKSMNPDNGDDDNSDY